MELSNIEQEAMDLLKDKWNHIFSFGGNPEKPYSINFSIDLNETIVGLMPKYIEKEKIKAQIEVLYQSLELTDDGIRNKANKLEQELKKIENE